MAAGIRGDLTKIERAFKFSGHSLRAGLASSAEVDERYVQKQLGHASAEMTRRYQRRGDRFRVNLTRHQGFSTAGWTMALRECPHWRRLLNQVHIREL